MSKRLEPLLIVPDTHRPYHNEAAWQLMLKAGKLIQPKHIVVIGDLCDFYAVSSHSKDPRRTAQLQDELLDVGKGLDELDSLKAPNKIFIAGNHCDRLDRYLREKAPELHAMVGTVADVLQLQQRGWTYVPYKHTVQVGKVYFTHDIGAAGRYATFKALDTFEHNVVTGHTHRLQYVVEGNALGEAKVSAQFGWLGDAKQIDYMHQIKVNTDWALGFGIGYVDKPTGNVYLVPVPIITEDQHLVAVVNGTRLQVRG